MENGQIAISYAGRSGDARIVGVRKGGTTHSLYIKEAEVCIGEKVVEKDPRKARKLWEAATSVTTEIVGSQEDRINFLRLVENYLPQ